MMMARNTLVSHDRIWLRRGSKSLLDLDHKPDPVSRGQFCCQRAALGLPHLSHQLIYHGRFFFLSFCFFEITEPVLKVLIYFLVTAPAPGNAGALLVLQQLGTSFICTYLWTYPGRWLSVIRTRLETPQSSATLRNCYSLQLDTSMYKTPTASKTRGR